MSSGSDLTAPSASWKGNPLRVRVHSSVAHAMGSSPPPDDFSSSISSDSGYMYLIRDASKPEGVYKIGKTTEDNPWDRLKRYPEGSKTLATIFCTEVHQCEQFMIRQFEQRFERRLDLGLEYFQGEWNQMVLLLHHDWLLYERIRPLIPLDQDVPPYTPQERAELNRLRNTRRSQPTGWSNFVRDCLSTMSKPYDIPLAYSSYAHYVTKVLQRTPYDYEKFSKYFLLYIQVS